MFDYLVDTIQRRTPPGGHAPEPVVRAAIDTGDPADTDSLAETAYHQGRYALAEYAYRQAWQAKVSSPDFGAEHPDTLSTRSNLVNVVRDLGRLEEAEAGHRAVLETYVCVLGAEHPDALSTRSNLANVVRDLGRLEEAEAEHRAVLETYVRVLGAEHPDTLASRNNLTKVLGALGRPEEAETDIG